MRIDFYVHFDPIQLIGGDVEAKLDELLTAVGTIQEGMAKMASDLTVITAQVEATNTVEASAIVLINGLAAQIADLKNDPVALQALADSMKAKSDELAAAITANTPAE